LIFYSPDYLDWGMIDLLSELMNYDTKRNKEKSVKPKSLLRN